MLISFFIKNKFPAKFIVPCPNQDGTRNGLESTWYSCLLDSIDSIASIGMDECVVVICPLLGWNRNWEQVSLGSFKGLYAHMAGTGSSNQDDIKTKIHIVSYKWKVAKQQGDSSKLCAYNKIQTFN